MMDSAQRSFVIQAHFVTFDVCTTWV